MTAYDVLCPTCFVGKGEMCTAPTSTGRVKVQWTHIARDEAAAS